MNAGTNVGVWRGPVLVLSAAPVLGLFCPSPTSVATDCQAILGVRGKKTIPTTGLTLVPVKPDITKDQKKTK